jgi:putative membrane-bound dehydrogenase-like protein
MPKTAPWFFVLSLFASLGWSGAVPQEPPGGTMPAGSDGKPLNLDFESGTLRDWTATGEAFAGQPIRGDTVAGRRPDMKSEHAGTYWVGGCERLGDRPQGTLTSVPFVVTQPFASFLVGGGPHPNTCVELVRQDTQEVFFRVSGDEAENMRRVVVDLSPVLGKQIFVRLLDRHSGGWGHVNFDDFRLHGTRPQLPQRGPLSPAEVYAHAGLAPEQAAQAMTVPEGFRVTLFAGEPDIVQPIAMAIDDRGRLWVAEAYSYPTRLPDDQAQDRILIFEDKDGDGRFDSRKVFAEKLNLVSGLELGFGGVWVGAAPYLLFIPDRDGDDRPDGPPQVRLDGWGYQDTHETLNAFRWGPDGWLYGCHGVFTHSRVGKPGTPDDQRVPINAGIWRYHPTRHVFEVFAHGTSNPWGVDFNEYGQCFLTACVIPHLYHMIQGARYERQGGQHFNPHTYDDLKTIADHRHYVGNQWRDIDRARSDDSGGGHAHAGAMVYLGGTWPEKYRGALFMNNIHGARINMDTLKPAGSGYVGSHGADFILTNDLWSQIIYLTYGPDGNVYMIDWYEEPVPPGRTRRARSIERANLQGIVRLRAAHGRGRPGRRQRLARPARGRSAETERRAIGRAAPPSERLVRSPRAADLAGACGRRGFDARCTRVAGEDRVRGARRAGPPARSLEPARDGRPVRTANSPGAGQRQPAGPRVDRTTGERAQSSLARVAGPVRRVGRVRCLAHRTSLRGVSHAAFAARTALADRPPPHRALGRRGRPEPAPLDLVRDGAAGRIGCGPCAAHGRSLHAAQHLAHDGAPSRRTGHAASARRARRPHGPNRRRGEAVGHAPRHGGRAERPAAERRPKS